jgi:hypothetical protein
MAAALRPTPEQGPPYLPGVLVVFESSLIAFLRILWILTANARVLG